MNQGMEKYLPIGTVVLLKGGTKRVMITGYCSATPEDMNKIYDYMGCLFPEGIIDPGQTALFDHAQIGKVYHLGLSDADQKQFISKLKAAVNNPEIVKKVREMEIEKLNQKKGDNENKEEN